ncbi:MAG TPA: hypothetical protein VGL68_02390 [Solirubrobacteraceae bacterium]
MVTTRRISLALCAVCLASTVFVSSALAAEPATVTVRVEGLSATKLPTTQVTTTTMPVVADGKAEDSCAGTSALGALQLATGGNWSGPWNGEFKQYEIYTIEGETHVFEKEALANYFWSFWLDNKEASTGACEAELHGGDQVLFFPSCYGTACPPEPLPLGIEAPAAADVGESVPLTVARYSTKGEGAPASGATISGAQASATTGSTGHATVTFSAPGTYTLRATAPESVRTEATICVHAGNDGTCGTTKTSGVVTSTSGTTTAAGSVAAAPYKGPYALVAKASSVIEGHVYKRGNAPRVLSGRVLAHTTVTATSIELRREYKGRCYAFNGLTTRFARARCGGGSFFKVSSNGVFSYLLPAALSPGRYVLDIQATDAAGNRTTPARGTTRIVFYVR